MAASGCFLRRMSLISAFIPTSGSPVSGKSLSRKWIRLIVSPPVPHATSDPSGMPRNHSFPVA